MRLFLCGGHWLWRWCMKLLLLECWIFIMHQKMFSLSSMDCKQDCGWTTPRMHSLESRNSGRMFPSPFPKKMVYQSISIPSVSASFFLFGFYSENLQWKVSFFNLGVHVGILFYCREEGLVELLKVPATNALSTWAVTVTALGKRTLEAASPQLVEGIVKLAHGGIDDRPQNLLQVLGKERSPRLHCRWRMEIWMGGKYIWSITSFPMEFIHTIPKKVVHQKKIGWNRIEDCDRFQE